MTARDRDPRWLEHLTAAAQRVASDDAGAGPPPEHWHRLKDRRERSKLLRRWAVPTLALAVVALAIGGALAKRARPLTYVVDGGRVEANGYVSSAGAGATALRFSDGTRVVLARGTRMSIGPTSARGARLRVEEGQAHFEVTHRPSADWSVEAGPYRVQVTGTVFDVRWAEGDEAVVALHVGSVRVAGPHLAAPVTLAPGQRLVARLSSGELRLESSDLPGGAPTTERPLAAPPPPAAAPSPPPRERTTPARARVALAHPAASARADAPRFAPDQWSSKVVAGASGDVLAEARARGVDDVVGDVDARALAALADAARYAADAALSKRALAALRRRFPTSVEAGTAAFHLGRIADDEGTLREAVEWYRRYATEAPRGPYAAEAAGREMLDVERLSGRGAAAALARAYLERYPEGAYLLQARAILSSP
jgi:hypothetical protein